MFQILLTTIVLYFSIKSCDVTDIFDETADNMFESIIGDIYKVDHKVPLENILNMIKDSNQSENYNASAPTEIDNTKLLSTTEKVVLATIHSGRQSGASMTMRDFNMRKTNMNLARLLKQQDSPIPDFANDADDPNIITRRFDAIRRKVRRSSPKAILRQEYFWWENKTEIYIEKNKTVSLMEHYIYETRYKLPFVQLMRFRYKDLLRYQLGFCFALLKQLLQQQRMIYTTLVNNKLRVSTLHYHMKMYEKEVRLNVDIKDLIEYIRALEKERKRIYEPHYYDVYEEEEEIKPKPVSGAPS